MAMVLRPSLKRLSLAATAVAQAPVPQAMVLPVPLSQTRVRMTPSSLTSANSMHGAGRHLAVGGGQLFFICKDRLAHVHGGAGDAVVGVGLQLQYLDAGAGFYAYGLAVCEAFVVNKLADAAHAVAAHHALAPVVVVHAHLEVGHLGTVYQDQSVTAHAEVGAAPCYGSLCRVGNGVFLNVHIDVVVACTVHFCKLNGTHTLILMQSSQFFLTDATLRGYYY